MKKLLIQFFTKAQKGSRSAKPQQPAQHAGRSHCRHREPEQKYIVAQALPFLLAELIILVGLYRVDTLRCIHSNN